MLRKLFLAGYLLAFVCTANAQWILGGNTNLTSANNIFGNTASTSTTAGQQPIRFFAGGQERMRLGIDGRLRIGTAGTAAQALHVYQGNVFIDGSGNYGNLAIGYAANTLSQWAVEYLPPNVLHPGGMNFWKPWLSTNGQGGNGFGNYFLFMRNDGKIGVGTECVPSDAKMAVNGKVYARELEIQTNTWCDSVFADSYPLLPLDSLRNFISTNNHLPGIPSEAEVKQRGGMAIMEMNLQLLQKVEELHLYILQQEERILSLEKKLR